MDQLSEKEQAALTRLKDLVVGMEARRYLEQGRQGSRSTRRTGATRGAAQRSHPDHLSR